MKGTVMLLVIISFWKFSLAQNTYLYRSSFGKDRAAAVAVEKRGDTTYMHIQQLARRDIAYTDTLVRIDSCVLHNGSLCLSLNAANSYISHINHQNVVNMEVTCRNKVFTFGNLSCRCNVYTIHKKEPQEWYYDLDRKIIVSYKSNEGEFSIYDVYNPNVSIDDIPELVISNSIEVSPHEVVTEIKGKREWKRLKRRMEKAKNK